LPAAFATDGRTGEPKIWVPARGALADAGTRACARAREVEAAEVGEAEAEAAEVAEAVAGAPCGAEVDLDLIGPPGAETAPNIWVAARFALGFGSMVATIAGLAWVGAASEPGLAVKTVPHRVH